MFRQFSCALFRLGVTLAIFVTALPCSVARGDESATGDVEERSTKESP